jgi:hypothetical protein
MIAGIAGASTFCSGKFHGQMTPMTPSGWYSMRAVLWTSRPEETRCGAEGLLGVAEVPAHGLAHRPQLDGGVLEGLAGVAGDHSAQLVAVLEDVVEDPADDAAALGEAGGRSTRAWAARARSRRARTSARSMTGTSPRSSPVAGSVQRIMVRSAAAGRA